MTRKLKTHMNNKGSLFRKSMNANSINKNEK